MEELMERAQSAKVTAVVVAPDSSKYFSHALECLANQTLSGIEIIIVDDWASARTRAVCRGLAEVDPRVKIMRTEAKSRAAAKNICISAARGEYVAFFEPEDAFEETMLAELVRHADSQSADIDFCLSAVIGTDPDGKNIVARNFGGPSVRYSEDNYALSGGLCRTVHEAMHVGSWGKLFKTAFLKDSGIVFPDNSSCADIGFVTLAWAKSRKASFLERELMTHRAPAQNNGWKDAFGCISAFRECAKLASGETRDAICRSFADSFALQAMAFPRNVSVERFRNDALAALPERFRERFDRVLYPLTLIVAARDCEQYAGEFWNRLLQQTQDRLDIVIVDIGSADRTADFFKETALKDNRVRFFSWRREKKNHVKRALLAALKLARSQNAIATGVGSGGMLDDKTALEKISNALRKDPLWRESLPLDGSKEADYARKFMWSYSGYSWKRSFVSPVGKSLRWQYLGIDAKNRERSSVSLFGIPLATLLSKDSKKIMRVLGVHVWTESHDESGIKGRRVFSKYRKQPDDAILD